MTIPPPDTSHFRTPGRLFSVSVGGAILSIGAICIATGTLPVDGPRWFWVPFGWLFSAVFAVGTAGIIREFVRPWQPVLWLTSTGLGSQDFFGQEISWPEIKSVDLVRRGPADSYVVVSVTPECSERLSRAAPRKRLSAFFRNIDRAVGTENRVVLDTIALDVDKTTIVNECRAFMAAYGGRELHV